MMIMQTKQLGQIKTLEEKLHALEGHNQDLEHKLAEQDCVITNLVGDNLEHLPLGARGPGNQRKHLEYIVDSG